MAICHPRARTGQRAISTPCSPRIGAGSCASPSPRRLNIVESTQRDSHPKVVAAIKAQLDAGAFFLPLPNRAAIELRAAWWSSPCPARQRDLRHGLYLGAEIGSG